MRLPEGEHREQGENVIPLINIVFLLLIFFMLAGTLMPPDPFAVTPPEARAGLETQAPDEGLLLLSSGGDVAFEGAPTSLEALPEKVESRLRDNPSLDLTVKADARVSTHHLLDVMDALRSAGAERLLLLTTPDARRAEH